MDLRYLALPLLFAMLTVSAMNAQDSARKPPATEEPMSSFQAINATVDRRCAWS